jgi:CheY-like chemotaxis protein
MAAIVYLVRDLFFVGKIRDAAERLGVEVRRAAGPAEAQEAARGAALVILDLRLPEALDVLDGLAGDAATATIPSVGFIDHENVETMRVATERGCGTVLSKRRFSLELPELLSGLAARRG